MKKIFHQAKSALSNKDGAHDSFPGHSQQPQQQPLTSDQPSSIKPPSPQDVQRYCYQHGTNLGSIFVLEKWLTDHMYPKDAPSAELAAVTGNVKEMGLDAARKKFENHWNTYVSDADLDWLVNTAHCNSVRLPIGYFTLGPAYCHNTPFESVAGVYTNAWAAVKHLIARCHARGIGVLVDLHALPGGANKGDHSGTNSGKVELWTNRSHKDLATRCLLYIAKETRGLDGVIGIQVCNEAEWDAPKCGMYPFYDHVLSELEGIDNTMPIYISDSWNLGEAINYSNQKNSLGARKSNPVVIDTHLYWCFADKHKIAPQQIVQSLPEKLKELDGHDGSITDHGAAQVVIGEYSCVLSEESWKQSGGEPKENLVKAFGQAQSRRYQERSGGSFFWTYRMNWMDGGEWGFKQQTNNGAITAPHNLALSPEDVHGRIQNARHQQEGRMRETASGHCHFWDNKYPGQYEHHRFEQGWNIGFEDAAAFFGMRASGGVKGHGGDKIGMLDLWVRKRIIESGQGGKFVWEFEQGLRQGVRDFYQLAGI